MKKLVLSIVIISGFVALAAWLWTLQPTGKPDSVLSEKNQIIQTPEQTSNYDPADFSVLKTTAIILKGKAEPDQIVAISTGTSNTIIKADPNGNFQQGLTLQKGLNLVKVTTVSPDLKNAEEKILTYDVNSDTPSTIVFAGSVKTIFDTLITVSTPSGEKSIRAGKSTAWDIPKEKETGESTPSTELESVRIGDYAIAVGNYPDEKGQTDTIVAQKITILRENKPTNDSTIIAGTTLTATTNNTLSVKNSKDETVELTLDKNTTATIAGKDAPTESISKDKTAIIIYHQEDENNILDAIYIP